MRITLVQPPTNYEETFLLSPPLGLLSIGAAAENEGAHVTLLDFNLKGLQDQRWQTVEHFYPNAVELIEDQEPDVVGFTSMAIESHVCLEIARILKERNPDLLTVFGGPHFGAIAIEALEHYDWVDYIISGEGESPLQNLIKYIEGDRAAATMENIAYRNKREIRFEKVSKAGRDLDEIPFPAYHLVDMEEYFKLNPNKLVCFEHARGCFLKCSFCYSPQHWGHGESRKSIERILAELKQLKKMGIKELFWVSDNLLNSKSHAITICEAIKENELNFKWHCYGTMPQITEPVIGALSAAGCQSVFVGVDAVAESNKKKYQKSYFKNWKGLREKLNLCLRYGITPTCAFMLSPFDDIEESEQTLQVAILAASLGCFVRLNALTYYNASKIEGSLPEGNLEYSSAYSTVLFDTAELLQQNKFAKYKPELFPFHRTFTDKITHDSFAKICRISMKAVNLHKALLLRAFVDFGIEIFATLITISMKFQFDEIECRRIECVQSRKKFLENLYLTLSALGLPKILIDIDILTQKAFFEKYESIDIPNANSSAEKYHEKSIGDSALFYSGDMNLNQLQSDKPIRTETFQNYFLYIANEKLNVLNIAADDNVDLKPFLIQEFVCTD